MGVGVSSRDRPIELETRVNHCHYKLPYVEMVRQRRRVRDDDHKGEN